jgi:SH3-like domain-containing protein
MRLKLLVLLTLLLLLPTLTIAEIMTVSFSGAEMRSASNAMSSKVITKVATYSPLEVLEKGSEYYKVKDFRGRTGWVDRSLLSSKPGIVLTGDRANVRKGPGTNHSVVFQLAKGDTGQVMTINEKWLKIRTTDDRQGWVAKFLTWGH